MKVTVLVDKREKKPLLFPSTLRFWKDRTGRSTLVIVKTKKKTMPEGDYCLEGHEADCLIERKSGLSELSKNLLSDDYRRATAAFGRLAKQTKNPYLLLEATTGGLRRASRWVECPGMVVDAIASVISRYHLRLLLVGNCKTPDQKRAVGEFVLRLMLAHAFQKPIDYSGADDAIARLL